MDTLPRDVYTCSSQPVELKPLWRQTEWKRATMVSPGLVFGFKRTRDIIAQTTWEVTLKPSLRSKMSAVVLHGDHITLVSLEADIIPSWALYISWKLQWGLCA